MADIFYTGLITVAGTQCHHRAKRV